MTISDPEFTTNTLSTKISMTAGAPWWITIVYGPQSEADKIEFLQELRTVGATCTGPWLLCGDFNLIYREEHKNNSNLNRRMMGCFWRLINELALKEIYLNGRRYTWSNGQNPPSLVHLNRFFCTSDWEDTHGGCHLRCLASVISDNCLLVLDCAPIPPGHR